jgi:RsiW-degrading membrane proteinase PrsW (M82 family)
MSLILAAIAPAFLIIIFIYVKDKYEKEPKRVMLYSFLLGAIVSVFISTVLYVFFDYFLPLPDDNNIGQQFIKAFFVVALIEEFSKYVIVRYYSQPRKAFNEPFDGIVYAVIVSMGFAMVENLIYVFQGGWEVALIRAFTAVPAHATFGVLMGYFMGKAKFNGKRIADNLIGLSLAILFHGVYDFFLFIKFIPGIWIGAFISLIVAIILSRRAIRIHQKNSYFKLK